jgi:hypothetical protein
MGQQGRFPLRRLRVRSGSTPAVQSLSRERPESGAKASSDARSKGVGPTQFVPSRAATAKSRSKWRLLTAKAALN